MGFSDSCIICGELQATTLGVLIDAVGYVCIESVKYDDCMCETSLAETLNQD